METFHQRRFQKYSKNQAKASLQSSPHPSRGSNTKHHNNEPEAQVYNVNELSISFQDGSFTMQNPSDQPNHNLTSQEGQIFTGLNITQIQPSNSDQLGVKEFLHTEEGDVSETLGQKSWRANMKDMLKEDFTQRVP